VGWLWVSDMFSLTCSNSEKFATLKIYNLPQGRKGRDTNEGSCSSKRNNISARCVVVGDHAIRID
jgi:hypothetical protein